MLLFVRSCPNIRTSNCATRLSTVNIVAVDFHEAIEHLTDVSLPSDKCSIDFVLSFFVECSWLGNFRKIFRDVQGTAHHGSLTECSV